ncbi:hypothetical protein P3X46_021767 [Hevea brasiliensis]|uniref:F-box domain-containing protein n=1 Tax=Hevea brasiliensis TaxID=3981 RepID=A0ABQ9LKF5_HEVBR|nr:putative F-box protein PP2-B12 [Hevea brasiliensis]KAJ9167091.1 hypothetical protein P3X46_021767 [Hevea brasiliensis]
MDASQGTGISALPEGCISNVLSFTSPYDACTLSVVSSLFNNAAESDTVWERFLPTDFQSIISRSLDHQSLSASSSSKKQLYFRLCQNPILIDDGKKSFTLDKWTGKKCYMLSARDLTIVWGDTPTYWRWVSDPDSRFKEVAELISVCWLEICGKINTQMLSPAAMYTAYLVFKLTKEAYGLQSHPAKVSVGLAGSESFTRSVFLDVKREQRRGSFNRRGNFGLLASVPNAGSDGGYPKERADGWLEIKLGEFFNKEGEDGELEMSVLELKGGHWKGGLVVQGIEIRPIRE